MTAQDARHRIERMLDEADGLPVGPEERALLDEAARLADEAGLEELAYRARMSITPSAHMAGDTDAMIAAFGWCVGKHDSDPVRFPIDPGVHTDLLFQYKWMASQLASNSRFPRERVEAVHADMERRYREAGVGQSGVLQSRHDVALILGDEEAAARYIVERDAVDRDEYSHCEACVRSSDASFAQLRGDDAEALRLWEEILEQGLTCGEEPESAESEALLPLLRAGRHDEAAAAHLRSYRAARTNPDGFPIIANHLVFCAVTGNLARGLQLLERHLPQLAADGYREATHFGGLVAVGVLLDAVVDAGEGDTRVRGSDHPTLEPLLGPAVAPRTATELRDHVWTAAAEIAQRFDARNGNDAYARRLAAKRALRETRYDVPLGGEAFAPAPAEGGAEPTDALGWVARSRALLFAGDRDGARLAAERGLALGDAAVEPELRMTLVWLAFGGGEGDARAPLDERIAALRAIGMHQQADLEERIGLTLHGDATSEDLPVLEDELERARSAGGDPSVEADLLVTMAAIHADAGEPEQALELAELAAAVLPDDDPQLLRFSISGARASALLMTGRFDEAADAAQSALDDPRFAGWPLTTELRVLAQARAAQGRHDGALAAADRLMADSVATGVSLMIAQTAHLAAVILAEARRPAEAAARAAFALRHLERAEAPTLGVRFMLARLQLEAGEAALALENLETVYLEERAAGAAPTDVAETAIVLGEAARAAGEPGMAYRSWSEAVDLAREGGSLVVAARAGLDLGTLMLEYGDSDAVETFEQGLADARASEAAGLLPPLLHGLGRARVSAEDEAGLADLDEAAALAQAEGATWFAATVMDSKGRCLLALDRLDEGVGLLLGAADALATEGDIMAAASGEVAAARALAGSERLEEAAAVLRSARDRFEPGMPPHTGLTLELADQLEALGRAHEAAQLRDSVA